MIRESRKQRMLSNFQLRDWTAEADHTDTLTQNSRSRAIIILGLTKQKSRKRES